MSLQCETQTRTQGGITLALTGRLDSSTAEAFDREVDGLLPSLPHGEPLVLDFGRVTFISSMGIRSLIRARKAMQAQDGALNVIQMQPQVASVLRMTNLFF